MKETRQRNEKTLQEAFALYQKGDFNNAKRIYENVGGNGRSHLQVPV
ncbi:MAG: hypothetical protein V1779_16925 [bacterium]